MYRRIWLNSFYTFTTLVSLLTSFGVLIYECLYQKKVSLPFSHMFWYCLWPTLLQFTFSILFYHAPGRRWMFLHSAQSFNRWRSRLSGYVAESLSYHADKISVRSKYDDVLTSFVPVSTAAVAWHSTSCKFLMAAKLFGDTVSFLLMVWVLWRGITLTLRGEINFEQVVVISSSYIVLLQLKK